MSVYKVEIHRDVGFSIGLLMIRNKTIYIFSAALNFRRNKKFNFKSGGLQFYDSYDKLLTDFLLRVKLLFLQVVWIASQIDEGDSPAPK